MLDVLASRFKEAKDTFDAAEKALKDADAHWNQARQNLELARLEFDEFVAHTYTPWRTGNPARPLSKDG